MAIFNTKLPADIYDGILHKGPAARFWRFLSPRSHAHESQAPSVAARVSVVINFGNEQQNNCLRT
jgi:hypothetical protein